MEDGVIIGVSWLRLAVETAGAGIIVLGAVFALVRLVRTPFASWPGFDGGIRVTLGRYLALGLEFELGAYILSTAISPSWDQIGKLGAIAVIRTGLNYFLSRELEAGPTTG